MLHPKHGKYGNPQLPDVVSESHWCLPHSIESAPIAENMRNCFSELEVRRHLSRRLHICRAQPSLISKVDFWRGLECPEQSRIFVYTISLGHT